MRTRRFSRCVLTTIAALLLLSAGWGIQEASAQIGALFSKDITLHESTTTTGAPMGGGQKAVTATSYFSGNAMRRNSSDGHDTIIRYDQGKIINIDHKQKTYTELSFEALQQMIDKAASEAGVDNKEAMEAMKQVMGEMAGQVTVTKQGPGETIAGYATEKYVVKMPPLEMEVWAAPDLTIPAIYYDTMKLYTPPNPMFDMRKMIDQFKKIKGMNMKSVMTMNMMGMNMVTTTVVTSVEKGPIPASQFEVPAGYKAVPMKF